MTWGGGVLDNGDEVTTSVSVEDCVLAARKLVGHENVLSASRMNSTVVLLVSTVDKDRHMVNDSLASSRQTNKKSFYRASLILIKTTW